jgi:Fe-coproporphyrin III synthase
MECAVITTYRCNARCRMCHTWRYPSKASEEFDPTILEKIPEGMKRLNVTGGEPLLRDDIGDILRILDTKTKRLEVSTNGYFPERLETLADEFPKLTVRVSVEGFPAVNDQLRGLRNGFDRALRAVLHLKRKGLKDVGLAMTVSGENCSDLLDVYQLACDLDVELANAVAHNSFYFHIKDNEFHNREKAEETFTRFIEALLCSPRRRFKKRMKDWFRAYLNLGLLRHLQGKERTIACSAGTDTFFVDPWGRILACNGSEEPLVMGNLQRHSFADVWQSEQAEQVRKIVSECRRGCWMTGNAVPAMRRNPWEPISWVLSRKAGIAFGKSLSL